MLNKLKNRNLEKNKEITLIALVITILSFHYEKIKCSNSKVFFLTTI